MDIGPLTGVYKNVRRGIIALVYLCRAITPTVNETSESAEISWHPVQGLSNVMADAYVARVTDALRPLGPITRAHDGTYLFDGAGRRAAHTQ